MSVIIIIKSGERNETDISQRFLAGGKLVGAFLQVHGEDIVNLTAHN